MNNQSHLGAVPHDVARPPQRQLLELITSSWISQAIYVAAELGIADRLASGPRTSQELALETQSDEASLRRLLRALGTLEIVRELEPGTFELCALGQPLRRDSPESLHAWTRWWGGHLWPVLGNLSYSVRTGQSARSLLHGTQGFEHLAQDGEAAAIFNQALVELTRLSARSVVQAYDFSPFRSVVDVGGGYGELLAEILRASPSTRGVLFDLPHAIEGARRHFSAAGLAERCEFASGDFFDAVPEGADCYVLKSVIHDWNDEKSLAVLRACRRSMKSGAARLLLVEQIVPERLEPTATHRSLARSDLLMLAALGACERPEGELRALLERAGFRVERVHPTASTFSVFEACPIP